MLNITPSLSWEHHKWRWVGFALNAAASERLDDSATPQDRLPLNLDDPDAPPPSEFVSVVDFWISRAYDGKVHPSDEGTAGHDVALPAAQATYAAGGYSLFTYNGGVARSYFDGHASGSDSRELGWKAHTQYLGEWQYNSSSEYRSTAPLPPEARAISSRGSAGFFRPVACLSVPLLINT